ncbi:type VII secretion protein EccE [Micromonospora globbae]|jgi:type VII secretion protein EccE|uniref:Type VII secretion protein EccE n=1 Tax=Micromonospora globbae TaxID=1894969 RepID=A0A420F442_9ACTN|nr:type VII secretion protein EccE [Micromonospora globbae]RKF27687.1 type VII secretion protein EccE [Micromonospora globbae]WTF86819.1 type VII secretion protein EccE [Micromonospora globbae]
MTQLQAPPARTAAEPSAVPERPAAAPDQRRRGRVGPLVVGQLVAVELCAVAVWAALSGPAWVLGVVTAVALAVLVAVFARRGGRWWYEDVLLRRRLRERRERARAALSAGGGSDPRLVSLAPQLSVIELTDRGTRLGIGQDEHGWFAAVALHGRAGAPAGSVESSVVDRALRVLSEFTAPVTLAQVVSHTLVWYPAPGAPPAAHRTVWVALRLSVRDARAEAVARGGGLAGVHRTLTAGIGRLGKALNAAGLPHRALSRDELRAAVVSAAGLDLTPEAPVETWTGLRGGGWTHRCLALRVRPDAPLGPVVDAVTATSAPSHTVAAVVLPGRAPTPLLRVAAMDGHVEALVKVVRDVARRSGAPARPLDGQHGPGVWAATPAGALVDGTGSVRAAG